MTKIIITLCLFFLVTGLWAQNDTGAKIVPVSQAVHNKDFTIQVGLPYLGQNKNNTERIINPVDIRFPWDVLYLYSTFAEESFDISKGYFGDKIFINWDLRSNFGFISTIKIYKRLYTDSGTNPYQFVGSVSPSVTEYEDRYVEGGVLYEYKVVAEGISNIESLYSTYITGIGYRNPTAVVTGNVSYKGGNPVKDVIVNARSEGSSINEGSSLNVPATGTIEIKKLSTPINAEATLQAWLKPKNAFENDVGVPIRLFQLSNLDINSIDVTVNLLAATKVLVVNIGGSEYKLHNYFPSGKLNAKGDDIMVPVTDFNSRFVHFSVLMKDGTAPLLFINGRQITQAYKDAVNENLTGMDPNYVSPYFNVTIPTQTNTLSLEGNSTNWDDIYVGGGNDSYIDEIRIWKAGLEPKTIRTDYTRYISGNDSRMVTYLRSNEKVGSYAYDLSRDGFEYNKNHGNLWNVTTPTANKVLWALGIENFPTTDQLGILGVTDINGNYEISAIPYSGTGESFNITPLFGQHQFEPGQQLVFLGQGSEVVNKIDFIDKSSFSFKGKILYDTRGVFKSFVDVNSGTSIIPNFNNLTEGDEYVSASNIIGEGYNYYETLSFGKKDKGEYWKNDNETPNDPTDDYLERYAKINSEGVNIYIDGNIVMDENNIPVVSDSEGNFDISVPIGNHYITLKKDGHTFVHNSRFPAQTGTFKEFFEDSNEQVIFIDDTRVTVVGRVVGGSVEAAKEIGFGENGLFEKTVTGTNGNETITISSKNNIGVADITLGYKPGGSAVTEFTKFNFKTNKETGEYRVELLPLDYELKASDISIPSATAFPVSILEPGKIEEVKVSKDVALTTPEFQYDSGNKEVGSPYHYKYNFNYRSTPVLKVTEQTSDKVVNGISTQNFTFPVYSQFIPYKVVLNRFERYTNYDDADAGAVEDLVPVIDGELLANNNLALAGSESIVVDPNDGSILTYTFKGGLPAISYPFTLLSTLKYRINGIDYDVENYKNEGIILGGKSDGTQTFVTAAPDIPDIILRDPPGSNSFASIEKGQSITFTTESSFAHTEGIRTDFKVLLGVKFGAGGGLAGPVITVDTKNNIDIGIGISGSSKDGKSLTKTYTFSQTISTSDDPDFVGSEGDLYIGNSKNQFYGSFDNIQASTVEIGNSTSYELANDLGESIFVSKQKAVYFVEEPSNTFFVFSQKHVLTTLIPEYELFISNIENGLLTEGVDGTLTIAAYQEQIRLWKKLILDNERSKYLAKNEREEYKTVLANVISNFNSKITTAINASDDPLGESNLRDKLDESTKLSELLNKNFDDNISFDAGVGEFTRSVETTVIAETATEYNLTLDESITTEVGFNVNGTGIINTTNAFFQQDINTSLTEEEQTTANISYTLKDNDPANLLSVDVVNSFDGNGPIFITQGGRTSCPYEGPEESVFFTEDKFAAFYTSYFDVQNRLDANQTAINNINKEYEELKDDGYSTVQNRAEKTILDAEKEVLITEKALLELNFSKDVDCCPDVEKAKLNFATQRVENIRLTIEGPNDISNVPEGRNAEFVLKLENLSDIVSTNPNYNYFDLVVDNTSNPDNALINIGANGTSVYVPYGEPVYYKLTVGKSISDVYDYENITVYLASSCDPVNVYSEVQVSAHFIPSCSQVIVNAPLNNWTYNRDEAYNLDGSTKPLSVNMIGFNTSFANFKKIDLEYRSATSPNWTRLHSYYGNQTFYDAAVVNAESEISLINSPSLSFSFDIAGLNIPDGDYEIRARSSCSNDTEFISDVIKGRVDLKSPQRFGTPLPIDGILGTGEDLKVTYNEKVFYNSAVSNIEIKGQTNQLPINHNVSLHFEGTANTAVINDPKISSGDFTMEFWMNNSTQAATATIFQQAGGLSISLDSGEIIFTLGGVVSKGTIANDGLYHHYTFTHKNSTGEMSIYQDDAIIGAATGSSNLQFANNNSLVIGGNTFTGNIHGLRLWNKTIGLDNAYAKMYDKLIGNEANLIGYWPMDEGRGDLAKDLARFKHAVVNADWDIKPKGNSYDFRSGQYLVLDNVGFVQLTKEMDATISFWVKTPTAHEATLFSNGKGDGTDIVQSNGLTNKWAINMTSSGTLTLVSEGNTYLLTSQSVADGNWHHIALLFNRIGSLKTYVDAAPVSSNLMANIGGFSGNKIWLGSRGSKDLANIETVDRPFTGKIDEFRLWNTLRNVEQISRDRYNEVDVESIGLQLYARMNAPDPEDGNGPRYFHAAASETITASLATLNSGNATYSNDVPAIKPERDLIKFQVDHAINGDEMILEPVVTDWASLEGQILDITVHRMFDNANNMQQSPITWTAYVKRNEVNWFAEGYNEIVEIVKNGGEEKSFEITVLNKGGKGQPYTITNIPSWLKLSETSGTINPDSKIIITATIDKELTSGEYLENLYLQTDFGFDEKLQVKVRVLAPEPDWAVDPTDFDYSMNIVGRIKVSGSFSTDRYDKIAAFFNGQVRGSASLVYDESYQEYFAYLTVYSNNVFGENLEFSIWDASQGKILIATIDSNLTTVFKENEVLGSLSVPVIFENSDVIVQEIPMNKGWTWISLNVKDVNFSDINNLTSSLNLSTSDRILSHSPAQLETYYKDGSNPSNSGWAGTVSLNGGLSVYKMYKVNLNTQQSLIIKGNRVDISTWQFPIKANWNWLPYPLGVNQPTSEALAYFDAVDGDVIKSQNLFAIYDQVNGWKGTLNYLTSGNGYMIRSSKDQSFSFPVYLDPSSNRAAETSMSIGDGSQPQIETEFMKYAENMNAVVLLPDGYHELFAYNSSGVLIGRALNQRVDKNDLSFITIYGDSPGEVVFYIGDGFKKKPTKKVFSFKSNDVLGTVADPIILEEYFDEFSLYPNPFENELNIRVDALESQTVTIELYSVLSQLVFTQKLEVVSGENWLKISPNIITGVYVIKVMMKEKTKIGKVIKN